MMLDFLVRLDKRLFVFFNQTIENSVLDLVMPFITEPRYFIIPFIIICLGIIILWRRRGVLILLWGAILITITDQLCHSVLKPMIDRSRPCHELDMVRLLINCGGVRSFPSSHAINIFAAATYFGEKFLHRRREFFLVASLVGLSRIYCGVHYPFDVLAGAALGIGIGLGICHLDSYLGHKYPFLSTEES